MGDRTGIEWTDATWNPIRGCSRVSEGCRFCYAETVANRFKGEGQPYAGLIAKGGQWNGAIKFVPEMLEKPLQWTKPRRIFVNSMSDLFHESVPDEVIDRIVAVMAMAAWHTFQVLTKRPERMRDYFAALTYDRIIESCRGADGVSVIQRRTMQAIEHHFGWWPDSPLRFRRVGPLPLPNVWLGVSVEDQKAADERIPLLLQTPAAVRWISAEPLLGPVKLPALCDFSACGDHSNKPCDNVTCPARTLDWVVVGGESGPHARPMHPQWARDLRDQCAAAGVPFLMKQWGEWRPICQGDGDWYQHLYRSRRVAKDGEDQDSLDESWGRDCTVAELCLRNDGEHVGITEQGAWAAGTAPVHAFKVGKKAAGRLLDGVQHDGYPGVRDV
jgi:protein gp37